MSPLPTRFALPSPEDLSFGRHKESSGLFESGLSPLEGGATGGPAKPVPRWPLDDAARWRSGLLACLALAVGMAAAQPATRAELAAQRAAIEQRFAREQAECEQRFAVSPCLEDLRKRRQAALAPLIRHEHELDAEDRRARAAAQVQRVKERELAAAQDEGQRRQRLVATPPPSLPAVPASHVKARNPEAVAQERQQSIVKAEREAARRRERAEERQARMRERADAHEAKEKARTRPPAAPLPLPGASAAPR